MKFGKYLALRQLELPEYSGHFIDYKALKKLIKQLAVQLTGELLQENKASFFFRVERELDKVNLFYLEKQANLAINLDLLLVKKSELLSKLDFSKAANAIDHHHSHSHHHHTSSSSLRNSISYLNLYQNFKKIHQDLIRLQQFIELNETGFSKVVKKWDKRSKLHTKELFILSAVNVQPVFHKNEINDLSDLVTQCLFDLESIVEGDFSQIRPVRQPVSSVRSGSLGAQTDEVTAAVAAAASVVAASTISSSLSTPPVLTSRHGSIVDVNDGEIDDLYSSFVNVATIKDPDFTFITQWIEKVKDNKSSPTVIKFKFSKVFLLSIANFNISDTFLESFLNLIEYNIDLAFNSDDLNNNKNILHECCSMPSSQDEQNSANHHVIINNGVKVSNLTDYINHSRTFIVSYLMENSTNEERGRLLASTAFNGRTCLHYASQYNRLDLLDIILPYFPKNNLDDLDNESMSALLLAIKHDNFDVVSRLVESGSNCFPKTSDAKLQYLPVNYACKIGNYQILEYILLQSQDSKLINQQDVEGLFPLHVTARSGYYSLIKLLIENGAEVNQFDGLNKWTPLFYSALEGNVKTTEELVKFGAKIDLVDEDGYDALYYCVIEGHIKVLNKLLNYHNGTLGIQNTEAQDHKKKNFIKEESINSNISSSSNDSKRIKNFLNVNDLNPRSINSAISTMEDHSVKREDDSDDDDDNIDIDSSSTSPAQEIIKTTSKNNKISNKTGDDDFDGIDAIPDLQLPPPILPLRRYGHNFLEQKVLIELIFPQEQDFITLFNSVADLKPGRLTLTSNISDIVPRNILLPMTEDTKANNCIFQTEIDSLHEFRIDFEIFPKFGTRLIAKTTALSFSQIDTSSPEINSIQLPLFDFRLRNIGELKFKYQVIFPFAGTLLETSKFDTYWKTSTFVKNRQVLKFNAAGGLSPNNFLSSGINSQSTAAGSSSNGSVGSSEGVTSAAATAVSAMSLPALSSAVTSTNELISSSTAPSSIVTATSLSGEYLKIKVCLLNDGTPIVCPFWSISLTENIDLYLPNLSLQQLYSITNDLFDYSKVIEDLSKMTARDFHLIKKMLKIIYLPLDLLLEVLNHEINLNLEIVFPSQYEMMNLPITGNVQKNLNYFIDATLNNVFNHIRNQKLKTGGLGRSIIFLSSNSLICKILNWKQPNFPVFLNVNGIAYNSAKKVFESRTTNGLLVEEFDVEGISDSKESNGHGHHQQQQNSDTKNSQEVTIRSIKEAVNFTINNNLIGLISSVHLLNLVPKLVPLIRSRGLVLVASSDTYDNQENENCAIANGLDAYTKTDINGLRFNDVLSFKEDVAM